VTQITYDLQAAKVLHSGPVQIDHVTVQNITDQTQTSTISRTSSVSESRGWMISVGIKVGMTQGLEVGIPEVGKGTVGLSIEMTNTISFNESLTRARTWGFSVPVSVAPHSTVVALVVATMSTVTVPYSARGKFILQSGARVEADVRGTYTGSNSHDLVVTFVKGAASGTTTVDAIVASDNAG
jgi:hypothetical protein